MAEFHLTTEAYGWLLSGLALAYAAAAPLTGTLLDRLGLNKGSSLAVGAWSVCCAATSLVQGFAGLVAARVGLGMLESAGVPAAGKMSATYLRPSERAVGAAINQVGLSLGGILAPILVYWMLARNYSWRAPFIVAGGLGLLWVPLWLLVARLIPPTPPTVPESGRFDGPAWRDRRMLILGGVNMLYMSTYVAWSNFTTLLLTQRFHETAKSAAAYAWFPPVAASLGGFAGGWLSMRLIRAGVDPVEARTRAVLVAAVGCLVTLAVPLAPNTLLATLLIGASYFATVAGSVNIYTIPLDLFGAKAAATATSVLITAYGLLQIVLSPVIGKLVDRYGFGPVCVLVAFPPLLAYLLLRFGITPVSRNRA